MRPAPTAYRWCSSLYSALFNGITINACQLNKDGQEEWDKSLHSIGMVGGNDN